MPAAVSGTPTATERREELAWRVDQARELMRPVLRGETLEARLARRCWRALADAAELLVDDDAC